MAFLSAFFSVSRPTTNRSANVALRCRFLCAAASPAATSPTPEGGERTIWRVAHTAPQEPGVYRFLSPLGDPLYIGKARRLHARLRQYVTHDSSARNGVSPAAGVSPRIAAMVAEAVMLDYIVTGSESAALALEASMVQEQRPRYNVLLKDDRRHPFALITFSEQYPRVLLVRSRRVANGDRLYGPFVDEVRLRQMLNCIHSVFMLRQRAKKLFKDRPCINYDLGRCPGVCQQLVTVDEYRKTVDKAHMLLSGRVEDVVKEMRQQMASLSQAMQYEQAAQVRDRIAFVESVFGNGMPELDAAHIVSTDVVSRDVFMAAGEDVVKVVLLQVRGGKVINRLVFTAGGDSKENVLKTVVEHHYAPLIHPMEIPEQVVLGLNVQVDELERVLTEKRGKNVSVKFGNGGLVDIAKRNAEVEVGVEEDRKRDIQKGVEELEKMLQGYVQKKLTRIEGYDISHTAGRNAVASMVVFENGVGASSEYRRYYLNEEISSVGNPDDFESIREAMRKRFTNEQGKTRPDLIVIDGGKGQLSAANGVLKELGVEVSVISIAKGEEEVFIVGKSEAVNCDNDGVVVMNDGVRLVCRIRDEAHRTAVRAHRKRRGRYTLMSGLNSIKGLGEGKANKLLQTFNGSIEGVTKAGVEDLQKVQGIGPGLAKRIYDHFNA